MAEIVLLDGGNGQELVARSAHPATPLWATTIMEREPDLVRAVHRDFIDAGATVITLNSYTATPHRIARDVGTVASLPRFEALQCQAIRIAQAARSDADRSVAIAGCLPPLVGSYHSTAVPPFDACLAAYDQILALQGPACDVILAETMSSVREARAAARACANRNSRAWIAFTVDDADGTRLRSGEPLDAGVEAALEEGAEAILLNCSRPEAIGAGIPVLARAGIPFGAYANGFMRAAELNLGATVAGMAVRADLGAEAYARHAMEWIAQGATIVGGCCEVGPGHIRHLHDRIRAAGHTVVTPIGTSIPGSTLPSKNP